MAVYIAEINFDILWVLNRHNDEVLPIDLFTSSLSDIYGSHLTIIESKLSSCKLRITADKEQFTERINATFAKCFPEANIEAVFRCKLSDAPAEAQEEPTSEKQDDEAIAYLRGKSHSAEKALSPDTSASSDTSSYRASRGGSALDKIEALIGNDDFKELVREIHAVAPQLTKYNAQEAFIRRSYLFAINDGYGLSTCLDLFAEFLSESKIVNFSSKKLMEIKLDAPNKDNSPLEDAAKRLLLVRNSITVVCIDISEWMTKVSSPEFKRFLRSLSSCASSFIYIFRVPFIEKDVLRNIQHTLDDVMITKPISFIPLDIDQLVGCAKDKLAECGFTADDDVWEVFATRINEEKSDGRFYGISTVHKVVNEMIYIKLVSNATTGEDNSIIQRDEIKELAHFFDADYITADTMLDEMIGMSAVATRVREIIAQIVLANESENLEKPCLHMRFVGNPGTGKTTVARIVGKLLKENGILRNGQFFEYAGRDLVGSYVGHTAPKTAEICRDAYGSVLFIDEAYSLYRDTGGRGTNDFGREALDTLIAEMENHRNDLVVIMAGYPDEMAELMKGNVGLESRMPYLIQFPNFSKDDLFQIFMQMVRRSFEYDDGFEKAAKDFFDSIDDETIQSKEFCNARLSRNLYERTWGKAAVRRQLDTSRKFVLIAEDLANAISDNEFSTLLEKHPNSRLGF